MSKIKLPHASGNSMSIAAPATNPSGDLTLTLPVNIGADKKILAVNGSGNLEFVYPTGYGLFMAKKTTTTQTLSHNTHTIIQYDSEDIDTQGWYDTSTYKYTPQVAGWYQIYASHYSYNYATQGVEVSTNIMKNGSSVAYGFIGHDNYGGGAQVQVSAIIQLNGSSDYVQGNAYQYNSGSSNDNIHGSATNRNVYFYGYLVEPT